jgi:hypothetical protein
VIVDDGKENEKGEERGGEGIRFSDVVVFAAVDLVC